MRTTRLFQASDVVTISCPGPIYQLKRKHQAKAKGVVSFVVAFKSAPTP